MDISTLLDELTELFSDTEYVIGRSKDKYSYKCIDCSLDNDLVFKIWLIFNSVRETIRLDMEVFSLSLRCDIPDLITFKGNLHPERHGSVTYRGIEYFQIIKICEYLANKK